MGRVYTPSGPVALQFHNDPSFFRGLRGPIGSGKTVACCYELFHMAQLQEPYPEGHPEAGWKKTRWAVIRNTYRMLETSTIKTWLKQFPEGIYGKFKWSPPFRHLIRDEASKFEMEVVFLALDDENNTRDLLSTEWTGCFINEARELPKGLVDDIVSRMRRFPERVKELDFGGATRPGVVADTNAPGMDHWWPILAGDSPPPEHWPEDRKRLYVKPKGWKFFTQPPALFEIKQDGQIVDYRVNKDCENFDNLHVDYYPDQWAGKEKDWIDVYLMNRYRTVKAGKPVYPDFDQELHIHKRPLAYNPDYETFCGIDFGLTPAAVILQRTPTGVYTLIHEFVAIDMDIPQFARWLTQELGNNKIRPADVDFWGDPAGDSRDQQAQTAMSLCYAEGLIVKPAPTNDPTIRIASVNRCLTELRQTRPRLKINPGMHYIEQGFIHGYRYRKLKVAHERYEEKPDKNKYSHPHDALQYAMLGAGEGAALLQGKQEKAKPITKSRAERNFDAWGSHSPRRSRRIRRFG